MPDKSDTYLRMTKMKKIFSLVVLFYTMIFANNQFKYVKPDVVETIPTSKISVNDLEKDGSKEINSTVAYMEDQPADADTQENKTQQPTTNMQTQDTAASNQQMADSSDGPTLQVTFESGKYKIPNIYNDKIREIVTFLKHNKDYQLIIYGYSSIGNKSMAQKRANFLKKRFMADGINPIKITAIGNVDDETAPKENMVETMLIN